MNLVPTPVAALGYLVAAVCFIVAIKGLASPRTARRGNLIGALGALLAVVVVLLSTEFATTNLVIVLVTIAIGAAVSVPVARRVSITNMPQLVALFNGIGGGAAALVGIIELAQDEVRGIEGDAMAPVAVAAGIAIGSLTLVGSLVTFLKLQGWMTSAPVVLPRAPLLSAAVLLVTLSAAVGVVLTEQLWLGVLTMAAAGALGVLLVLPVGGADVPIVISLLNATTGLAVIATGWAVDNVLLLVAGTLIGAAGTILTLAMAAGMGRSVAGILFGALKGGSTAGSTQASDRPVRTATAADVAVTLAYSRRVVVVPGYGLAVAQAQHVVAELVDALRGRDIDVVYGIHPVAGRMPGHMNVLLAEANVGYELLVEAADVNPSMPSTDVVVVVGANDVVNPAARSDPAAPIYGMPIIDADAAAQVIFLKRSMRPGFAGIENELLFAPKTQVLFGDAKASLTDVLAALKTA